MDYDADPRFYAENRPGAWLTLEDRPYLSSLVAIAVSSAFWFFFNYYNKWSVENRARRL